MTTIQEHGEQTGEIIFLPKARSKRAYPSKHLLKDDLHTSLCGLYDLDRMSDAELATPINPDRLHLCGRCARIAAGYKAA
jgi:hypothetical protein